MGQNLPALIEQSETRVAELLPEGMDAKRVVRLAKLAVHRNPDLLKCNPVSVIESILVASQLGLEINSPLGGAHLVPFKGRCTMIPDYRALIRLALKSGACTKLVAREVYDIDHFEIQQGSVDRLVHVPAISDEARQTDDIIAFYAVATLRNGESLHEWAPKGDVDEIRMRSPTGKGSKGPWATDYAAMGKKTIVKRLIKWLDIDPRLGAAIEADNRFEAGDLGPPPSEAKSANEAMAEATRRSREQMSESLDERRTEIIQGEPVDTETGEVQDNEQEELEPGMGF